MIFTGLPVIRNSEGLECTLPTPVIFYTSYKNLPEDKLSVLALYGILYNELIDEIENKYSSEDDVLPEEQLREETLNQIKSKCIEDKIRLNYVQVIFVSKDVSISKHINKGDDLVLDLDIIPLNVLEAC